MSLSFFNIWVHYNLDYNGSKFIFSKFSVYCVIRGAFGAGANLEVASLLVHSRVKICRFFFEILRVGWPLPDLRLGCACTDRAQGRVRCHAQPRRKFRSGIPARTFAKFASFDELHPAASAFVQVPELRPPIGRPANAARPHRCGEARKFRC
jgi:hypothetical protein